MSLSITLFAFIFSIILFTLNVRFMILLLLYKIMYFIAEHHSELKIGICNKHTHPKDINENNIIKNIYELGNRVKDHRSYDGK